MSDDTITDLASSLLHDVAVKWWTPDPSIVAKLPRGGRDPSARCSICSGWHKTGAVHLDFVGHADLTRTLIEIDPMWDWEPMAFTAEGLPLITKRGSQLVLWGRLTLLGKSRPCVGTADDKADGDKELVGDLLRNGAMRFGIFGALWSKTDGWHDEPTVEGEGAAAPPTGGAAGPGFEPKAPAPPLPEPVAITQPDKPLVAMTMRELLDFARENNVAVSGSKADIVRTLEPLVRAATGEEPFEVGIAATIAQGAREAIDERPEFNPVLSSGAVEESGTERARRAAIRRGDG